jgi:hypothetical protein
MCPSFEEYQKLFTPTYTGDLWRGARGESKSGGGSSLSYAENFKNTLEITISDFEVETIFDCSCGDWNWMRSIKDILPNYLGVDVVQEIIDVNTEKFSAENINFVCNDMLSELKSKPNDSIDLVICRQTFEHLSNGYIIDVLNEIKRVGKYLIINSNNTISENVEFTADGLNSRNINMDLEPFEPILGLPEFYFYDSIGQKTEGNLAYFYRLGNEI